MVHMDSINDEESQTTLNTSRSQNSFAAHNTSPSDSNSIILYPFAHQVGGHTQLLTLDKSTLCKPLIPRELLFYLNIPKELVKFVPSYKGVVQIRETGKGTYPPVVYQPLRSPKSPYAKYKPALCCNNDNLNEDYLSEEDSSQSVSDMCGFPFELKVQIRPCPDEKVLKKNLSQDNLLKADYISRPNEKYLLLLENVASKYQLPCILDLKMGTRQHGDDATEEKRHRQMAKCQASTSASLGVRLCGMQVYQVDYGGFLWYDKYYGRKMNEEGLKRALHDYFRNGSQLNGDIIDDVIGRLKLLTKAIENSPAFRFYGTSLLIIHEGCPASRTKFSKPNNSNSNTTTNTNINNNNNIVEILDNTNITPVAAAATTPTPVDTNTTTATSPITDTHKTTITTSITTIDTPSTPISTPTLTSTTTTTETTTTTITNTTTNTLNAPNSPLSTDNDNSSTTNLNTTTTNANLIPTTHNISKNSSCSSSSSSSNSGDSSSSSSNNTTHSSGRRCQVDVRLIDFAHTISRTPTTPPSLGSRKISKTSMGPDKGLLFGLENLMRLLDDLKSETFISC